MIVKPDKREARRKTLLSTHKVAGKPLNHVTGITQVSARLDRITIDGATKTINKTRIDTKFQEIETHNGNNLHFKLPFSNSTKTNFRHQINIINKQVRVNFLSKTLRFPKLFREQIRVSTTHMCNRHQKDASNVDIQTT